MQKYLILLIISIFSTQMYCKSIYNYQDVKNSSEFLKNLPVFWVHIKNELKQIENDSLSQEVKSNIKFSLLVDCMKWQYNYNHINNGFGMSQIERDSLKSFLDKEFRVINKNYRLNLYTTAQLEEYLYKDINKQKLMSISNLIGKYRPAKTADVFLNNWEQFITKDFNTNFKYRVEDIFPVELKVFQNDINRFEATFNKKQSARYKHLINLFEMKKKKWDTSHHPKTGTGGIDVMTKD